MPSGAAESARAERPDPTWERLEDQLRWYSQASRRAKSSFQRLKVAELIVGATVPVVAALQVPAAITAVLAALVVIAEGVQQLFGWQRDWLGYRGVLQSLKREKFLFLAHAGPYTGPDRTGVLAARIETLMAQEHSSWTENHDADYDTGTRPQ
ncbi:DUF4231 domain-containing protein [Actinomycetospora sp. TBRC 11914]|uniref:DUF4231 domain-containing protein n=1 Tax=Actinomycetospora sp. TBRC 11914 TaxID=2729387 RepID=UPI00145E5D96|nr:DUF4231 domain-containing protein [Actinomycetospora sp. TBRC 11914]NMO93522.1 DUF4231 domain-containing protein [Actinomycetospora sp. TBRC 11914]